MSKSSERVILVSTKPLREYLIEIAVMFQEGAETIVIKGYGRFISKAVDLYNALVSKMGGSIEYQGASIGSEVVQGRSKPYIVIKVKRRY